MPAHATPAYEVRHTRDGHNLPELSLDVQRGVVDPSTIITHSSSTKLRLCCGDSLAKAS